MHENLMVMKKKNSTEINYSLQIIMSTEIIIINNNNNGIMVEIHELTGL